MGKYLEEKLSLLNKIPEGYKHTKVGMIPSDWEVRNVGDCLIRPPRYGIGAAAVDYSDQLPKYLRITDISEDGRFLPKKTTSVDNLYSANYFLSEGDLVVARTGASVGKSYLYRSKDGPLVFAGFLICLSSKNNLLLPQYLSNYFKTNYYWNWVKLTSMRSGQPGINGNEFSKLLIPLPNITEQKNIATALSDTDALIESLEKLIAKKKAIKQGAMQKLLTGKKRLPGFSGEWKTKKLGEIVGRITTGKLDANAMKENGEYRFYTCAKKYYYIDNYAFDTEALIVSGNGANVGYINYFKGKFNAYQRTYVLYDFLEDISFTKLFMDKNLQERIRVEVNAGNTPYITMSTLSEMSVKLPPTLEEQTTIANILSDMASEIEKLEQKRDKYILLKQGMMQQLLTGKIRLVKNGDN